MILHRPKRKAPESHPEFGFWEWCYCRRFGDHVVIFDWVRGQTKSLGNCNMRTTWRRADTNVIIFTEDWIEEPGW